MNVSEDQKRWLIVGIAFNNLVPQIRPFVEHSLKAEYHKLIHSNSIHVQTAAGGLLKKHPKPLKYENINGNNNHKLASGKFDFSRFDYRITSHVDFAKLYVQPFMAKFNAFDGACDGSAVLLLLGEVPAFSSAMQLSAKAVRDRVRNEWAHCNLTDWDAAKFKNCFHEMQTLVRSLRLSPVDEAKLLGELGDWETKGTKFCGNSPVDSSLLSLVHNEVSQLGSNLDDFVCKYKEEKDILETTFSEVKESLDQLLKLPQKVDSIENEVRTLKQQVADLSSDKSEESTKPPKFVGALDRNEYFTGRRSEMENLEKAFGVINTTPAVHAVAEEKSNVLGICGLGGCGKSSLAFEYAWRNIECYPGGVLVVNGESDEMLRKSLQRIHGEFVAAESVRDWSNQQNETAETFERVLSETLSWLGNLRDRWLLLVDNMDQKELSPCARRILLGQWKTKCSGHILVTSRRRPEALCEILDLASENCFELNPWSLDESVEFLKKRTELPPSSYQDQGVEELVEELGGLPLPLEQAAAYIKALKCSIQSYLQQYHLQKCTLLNVESAKPRAEIYTEACLAVETTWLLNFSYISNGEKDQGLGKAAAFFMKIAAYLSPDEIPIEILNVGAPEIEHGDLKKRLEMPLGATQIVELLVKFSLFKRKSNDSLSIHRLVQENLRDRCNSEGETNQVLASAIRMMHQTFLNCVGGTDFFRDFYNRLASLPRKQETNSLDFEGAIHLAYASMSVPLESRRWQKLSENGFHLVVHLLNDLPLKPRFFCEESARVFCEAAFHCYSLGVESQGHRLQQCVIEIVCAIKEPIRYYKDDGLLRISRILRPFMDSAIFEMRLLHSESAKETINDETGVPGEGTAQFQISEVIKMIEPKAKDAFSRGDFQTSADLYSDIVKRSNFNFICGTIPNTKPHLIPLGEILCGRGIAHLKMEKFEAAVDDFDASTYLDIQYFRGYYWKAYALCKLVESGRTEFTSRAQAAFAMLHFKFKHSKLNDIEKLQSQFAELLLAIEYKFVSRVSELKELERRFGVQNDFSNVSFTIILAEGCYDLKKMTILGGRFYFVCPPGNTATLNCIKGLYLSQGSFLFENITFLNPYPLIPAVVSCTVLGAMAHTMMMLNNGREEMDVNNFDTLTFGGTRHQTETEMTNPCALVEANDVHSLSMDHCLITDAKSSGIVVKFTESSLEERSVSVRLSTISCCRGTGLHLQENAPLCHISIRDNEFEHNLYGVFIDSPSPFHLENNYIFSNTLSGVVAVRSSEGRLVRNTLAHNGKHGILFAKTNAVMKGNEISNNHGWGVVCSCESDLHCADETLFERNLCGGLRVVFNGKGNVSVQRCEFRENYGPVVFPVDQLSRMEVKCNQLLTASQKSPVPFSVFFFLEGVGLTSPCISELKSPVLLDNRVSDDSEVLSDTEPKFCSTCLKDQETEREQIECPSCHVARYCSQECCDAAKPVHYPVCKSILEANKECHVYDVWPLSNAPPVEDHDAIRAGISMCIIATVTLTRLTSVDKALDIPYHFCLLTCPERELCSLINSAIIHHFVAIHGSHLPDRMLDTKAACILANFDSESSRITVYKHRIFPLEKVSDASKWLNKTLDVFGARLYGWGYSTPEPSD